MGTLAAEPGAAGIPQALADVGHQPLGILRGKITSISQKLVLFPLGEEHSWALGSGALLGLCPSSGET